jgi:hypothetical protein
LSVNAVNAKVIAVNRVSLDVKLMDEHASIFKVVTDICDNSIYATTAVKSLLIYLPEVQAFTINDKKVDALVDTFFPGRTAVEPDDENGDDTMADDDTDDSFDENLDNFSRDEDYWYIDNDDSFR